MSRFTGPVETVWTTALHRASVGVLCSVLCAPCGCGGVPEVRRRGFSAVRGAQAVLRIEELVRARRVGCCPTRARSRHRAVAVARAWNRFVKHHPSPHSTVPPCVADTWCRRPVQTKVKGVMRSVRPAPRATFFRRRAPVEVGSLQVRVHAPGSRVSPWSFEERRRGSTQTGGADEREGSRRRRRMHRTSRGVPPGPHEQLLATSEGHLTGDSPVQAGSRSPMVDSGSYLETRTST